MNAVLRRLDPDEITLDVEARNKSQVLGAVASICERSRGLASDLVYRALSRREDAGSTALGRGIAIPHARLRGIARPVTLFMRTREPLEFGAPDGRLVSQFFVILVPADGDTDEHLQLLAGVAEMFSNSAFRDRLTSAATPSEVGAVFTDWVEHLEGVPGGSVGTAWLPGGA